MGAAEMGRDGMDMEIRTGNGVVTAVFRPYATVSVAVEASHRLLGEEGEGFLEDCLSAEESDGNSVSVHPINWLKTFWGL